MNSFTFKFYVFKSLLRMFFFFLMGISTLVFLIDYSELAGRFGNLPGYSTSLGLSLAALRLPFIVQVALPFIMLAATMTTLIQLNKKSELVIARSAGMSAWQFLSPTWLVAVLIGILGILVVNPAATYGFSQATETESSLRGRKAESGPLSGEQPWLRQPTKNGGTYLIGAERVSNNNLVLFNAVFLEVDADEKIVQRLDTPRARLNKNRWILVDATSSKAGKSAESLGRMVIPTDLDASVIREALVAAEMVPFFQLREQINRAEVFGITAYPFRMQYQSLLALPAFLVAMTLIAASVSLRFARFGQSMRMILGGIVAGFVLYITREIASSFGAAGIVSPVWAAWLPVVAAAMIGVAYLLHREDG